MTQEHLTDEEAALLAAFRKCEAPVQGWIANLSIHFSAPLEVRQAQAAAERAAQQEAEAAATAGTFNEALKAVVVPAWHLCPEDEDAYHEAMRRRTEERNAAIAQMVLAEPPLPRIYLTEAGDFGGLEKEPSGSAVTARGMANDVYRSLFAWGSKSPAPHKAGERGTALDQLYGFWKSSGIPRAWFDKAVVRLVESGLVVIDGANLRTADKYWRNEPLTHCPTCGVIQPDRDERLQQKLQAEAKAAEAKMAAAKAALKTAKQKMKAAQRYQGGAA